MKDDKHAPPLIQTSQFLAGYTTARGVAQRNLISAFDGEPGTGKTRCATQLVSEIAADLGRPTAITKMSHHSTPLEVLRRIHRTVIGSDFHGTRYELQNKLVSILPAWGGLLVLDELQNLKENGLQELVFLHEETCKQFALIIIGTGVLETAKQHRQLLDRIINPVTFKPLHGKELIGVVRKIDPLFANLTAVEIQRHDNAICRGNLRRWVTTRDWAQIHGYKTIGSGELKQIGAHMNGLIL